MTKTNNLRQFSLDAISMLNNSLNARSKGKVSLKLDSPITIVVEYLTAPTNELYIIFDLSIIFMLILFSQQIPFK